MNISDLLNNSESEDRLSSQEQGQTDSAVNSESPNGGRLSASSSSSSSSSSWMHSESRLSGDSGQEMVATRHKRKRKTYLSATQKAERQAHAKYQSNVLNLTLDVNELRQQVRFLEERRELHVTRLLLAKQQFQANVLAVMDMYFGVFHLRSRRRDVPSASMAGLLSHVHECLVQAPTAKENLPFFVWQWACYNNRFTHWRFDRLATHIVAFVEDDGFNDSMDGEASSSDQDNAICGPSGCVVECYGKFAGRPTRAMVAAMFPHLLGDAWLTALLTRQEITFPTRMLVYFDSRGRIVDHVLEADSFSALALVVQRSMSAHYDDTLSGDTSISELE